MNDNRKAYLEIHIAVVLFGITAILGKLIVYPEGPLVWHRLWISVLGLVFLPGVIRGILRMSWRDLLIFSGIGCFVVLHWLTFYGSIKIGNSVSITLATFATAPLFTAILEPLITGKKFQREELIMGISAIIGIYLVVDVDAFYYKAIIVGLISAFLAAFFSVLNKRYIREHKILSVTTVELAAGWVFLTLILPLVIPGFSLQSLSLTTGERSPVPLTAGATVHPMVYLVILGILCTSFAFALSLSALKKLSAFSTNLVVNLEPVYGILMAAWFFQEGDNLTLNFYIGTTIILAGVILHPYFVRMRKRRMIQ